MENGGSLRPKYEAYTTHARTGPWHPVGSSVERRLCRPTASAQGRRGFSRPSRKRSRARGGRRASERAHRSMGRGRRVAPAGAPGSAGEGGNPPPGPLSERAAVPGGPELRQLLALLGRQDLSDALQRLHAELDRLAEEL